MRPVLYARTTAANREPIKPAVALHLNRSHVRGFERFGYAHTKPCHLTSEIPVHE